MDRHVEMTDVIPNDSIIKDTKAAAAAEVAMVVVDNGPRYSVWKKVKRGFKFLSCQ